MSANGDIQSTCCICFDRRFCCYSQQGYSGCCGGRSTTVDYVCCACPSACCFFVDIFELSLTSSHGYSLMGCNDNCCCCFCIATSSRCCYVEDGICRTGRECICCTLPAKYRHHLSYVDNTLGVTHLADKHFKFPIRPANYARKKRPVKSSRSGGSVVNISDGEVAVGNGMVTIGNGELVVGNGMVVIGRKNLTTGKNLRSSRKSVRVVPTDSTISSDADYSSYETSSRLGDENTAKSPPEYAEIAVTK